MKKNIIAMLVVSLAIPLVTQAGDKDYRSFCSIEHIAKNHGVRDVKSHHGVSILNTSGQTQTYEVLFDNAVMYPRRLLPLEYKDPFVWVPNAHKQVQFTIENGKRIDYGPLDNIKSAIFEKEGQYKTKATTVVLLNGNPVSVCTDIGYAEIF